MSAPRLPLQALMSLRLKTPSAKRKKSLVTKLSTKSSRSSIARPTNRLLLFRIRRDSSRRHLKKVAKAWRILLASVNLKWQKAAQKLRDQHAKKYPGYTFKNNCYKKRKKEKVKPDAVDAPNNHNPTPPLSSFPDCPPHMTQLQDSIHLPFSDEFITQPTDQAFHARPQFRGQVNGIPKSLHRRSSSAPVLSERRALESMVTLTDFIPAGLNRFGASSHFAPRLSYSGIRPGFIPMRKLLPPSPLYHDTLAQHSIHTSVKQEEKNYPHIFDGYQKIDSNFHIQDSSCMSQSDTLAQHSIHASVKQEEVNIFDEYRTIDSNCHIQDFRPQQLHDDNRRDSSPWLTGPSHSFYPADRLDVMDHLTPKSWFPEGTSGPIKLPAHEISWPGETAFVYQGHCDSSSLRP